MKEILKIGKDFETKGYVTIDYKDPITDKIIEQIKGNNHVFKDSLFCSVGSTYNWIADLGSAYLVMTDDPYETDPNFPYIRGIMKGYGVPGSASSGTYRGSYDSAGSYLARQSYKKVSWKFVYNFGGNAALGNFNTVGLTHQYGTSQRRYPTPLTAQSISDTDGYTLSDGRYAYRITNAGVLTRYEIYTSDIYTIDLSAIIGSTAANTKSLGYDGINNKYYVYVGSSTAANRKLYEFNDNGFTDLTNIIDYPGMGANDRYVFFVHGEIMYKTHQYSTSMLFYKCERDNYYILNHDQTWPSVCISQNPGTYITGCWARSSCMIDNFIIVFGGGTASNGFIYDVLTKQVVGEIRYMSTSTSSYPNYCTYYPAAKHRLPCGWNTSNNCAVAQYKLPADAPERPEGTIMSVSYEIEVQF